jgi:hypothetical protein
VFVEVAGAGLLPRQAARKIMESARAVFFIGITG